MIEKLRERLRHRLQDYRTILSTMYGVYKLESVVVGNRVGSAHEHRRG